MATVNFAKGIHAARHAAGGADPVTPAAIKAVPLWVTGTVYAVDTQVVSPNNDVVKCNTAHTAAAAFATDVAKWSGSTTYAPLESPHFTGTVLVDGSPIGGGSQPPVVGSGVPVAPVNTDFDLSCNNTLTTGTFCMTFRGHQTSPLAWNCTAAEVVAALTSLSSVGSGNLIEEVGSGNDPNVGIVCMFVGALGQAATEYPTVTNDTTDGEIIIYANNGIGSVGSPADPSAGATYVDQVSGLFWLMQTTEVGQIATAWSWRESGIPGWSSDGRGNAITSGGHLAASDGKTPPDTLTLYDDQTTGGNSIQLDPTNGLLIDSNVYVYFLVGIGATMQVYIYPDHVTIETGGKTWAFNSDGSTSFPGGVSMANLPTSPGAGGALWNNAGVVTVS